MRPANRKVKKFGGPRELSCLFVFSRKERRRGGGTRKRKGSSRATRDLKARESLNVGGAGIGKNLGIAARG